MTKRIALGLMALVASLTMSCVRPIFIGGGWFAGRPNWHQGPGRRNSERNGRWNHPGRGGHEEHGRNRGRHGGHGGHGHGRP
jgi:hypothetical protein